VSKACIQGEMSFDADIIAAKFASKEFYADTNRIASAGIYIDSSETAHVFQNGVFKSARSYAVPLR
jgi:hypothetical protein